MNQIYGAKIKNQKDRLKTETILLDFFSQSDWLFGRQKAPHNYF